jgi:hypothetical protein
MALAIFNEFSTLKLLSIGEMRFTSVLVMLKRTKLLKIALQTMVISSKVSDTLLEDLIRICKEAWNRLKLKYVPLPSAQISSVPQKRKQRSIENAFNVEDKNHLRESIARMFYSGCLSFHLARNPYYVSSYSFDANHSLSGFLPPSYNAPRTTLLKQERAHIDRLLQPMKSHCVSVNVILAKTRL